MLVNVQMFVACIWACGSVHTQETGVNPISEKRALRDWEHVIRICYRPSFRPQGLLNKTFGEKSQTVAQHWSDLGSESRFYWVKILREDTRHLVTI